MESAIHNETRLQAVAPVFQTLFGTSTSAVSTVLSCLVIWWFLSSRNKKPVPNIYGNYNFEAPIVGYKNAILGRWQFYRNGPALIRQGYAQYRDTFFKVSGNDLLIVPNKYLAELASMPPEKLSLNTAIVDAFQRLHSITAVITDHSLQTRMITTRLTPKLGAHVPLVQEQFRKHLPQELPATADKWTSVNALSLARRMVHRGVATQFVTELAENEEYLSTAINYSEHGFMHNFLLRVFPDWAKPTVAFFLPTSWGVDRALRKARRLVIPLIRERRRREAEDVSYVKPDDFLQHLMDGGVDIKDDVSTTVQRLMVTYLGSGPSTIIAVAQVLFDLCAHPEYVEPLRQEAIEILSNGGYTRQAIADMKKMDSFMRESQRLSPPTQLGFNAIVREPVTLHDGVVLPEGAHIQMATYAIGIDPDRVPDPEKFDGMRQYKNRQISGQGNWHQFTTTSENNLHFGHGKIVCPGRFFADHSIKMIISNILIKYHLRFAGGRTERPSNTSMYDVVIPDLNTCVEFKLREDAAEYAF
ncbi:phoma betae P450 monooxygenase No.2 [Cordyceps fumosorosea ARSEF 2679]|uniref:Phoma betae P450 monooxygenase No.2 n=1 Tax=Cordyceps fumosorosea (strain ARSEF 2679) TaxID=1081104 RepID=A0A167LKN1_CORFA|nr:phoma betae P450 monooxygenase No.2 [Cordyceps fumosorosea ARSEF 2679]OAA53193.1 phoma betae P450 monooxygenase No.2 [Cordyceps fumosorosea ARSEF 2679]